MQTGTQFINSACNRQVYTVFKNVEKKLKIFFFDPPKTQKTFKKCTTFLVFGIFKNEIVHCVQRACLRLKPCRTKNVKKSPKLGVTKKTLWILFGKKHFLSQKFVLNSFLNVNGHGEHDGYLSFAQKLTEKLVRTYKYQIFGFQTSQKSFCNLSTISKT